jgi:hypothetical protein
MFSGISSYPLEFFHFSDLIMYVIFLLVIGVVFIFGKVRLYISER